MMCEDEMMQGSHTADIMPFSGLRQGRHTSVPELARPELQSYYAGGCQPY